MRRVERLIVGRTLASNCFDGVVLDTSGSTPYPLTKVNVDGKNIMALPIIVERCPRDAMCSELKEITILKEGDELKKACGGMSCQTPWPLRWKRFKKMLLVNNISIEMKNPTIIGSIKRLDLERKELLLRGGRKIEFAELVWTAPYDTLSSHLKLRKPRALEATVTVVKGRAEWDVAYHFGKNNPVLSMVRYGDIIWALAPGSVDPRAMISHAVRKGYLKEVSSFVSFTVRYYALSNEDIVVPEELTLKGRAAQWKEMSLEDLLKCV